MEAAAVVERLWPGRPATIRDLSGGITNRNYRVDVDGSSYVLRMGGQNTNLLGIDRVTEHAASLRAAEIGVGPQVEAFIEPEGWLVTRFIDGTSVPPEEIRTPQGIRRVAAVLLKMHRAAAIPGRFDAHAVVDQYRVEAEAHGVSVPPEFAAAHEVSERIRGARGPQVQVPCHNDLLNANFLDDGEIRIVDWEYAGMGDRCFDLANLSVNHEFGLDEDRMLVAAYFGVKRPADLAALRLMRFMSDFREAMWGVLQSGISELDFDFNGYAAKHFQRLQLTAADPKFREYLAIFS
ncbi:MAG TPA: phosphotransferase [Candidatus Dormibacteraeota bacterium]|nr:phosphotransferase [Candidatus Dormibacteraeota bacterium]